MTKFRSDIQALRGIAVALVVLDHIGATWFKNGYLGVDIFFVISGFLITGIISKQIAAGTFSFKDFYLRRAKRLLPAAYLTILLTAIGSAYFLNSVEADNVTSQIVGALTFSINFVLWDQVGYFDVAAASKPLLHMWSLAIEEQFYILFPAILALTPAKAWRYVLPALAATSLVACAIITVDDPSTAFYLLPTRAWELLIGAMGALFAANQTMIRCARAMLLPAFAALAIVPFASTGYPHPGVDAAIVCLATVAILVGRSATFERIAPKTGLVFIGNISYSLYLVHWPLIVFMNNAFIHAIPINARIFTVGLAVALAYLMYRNVEEPFRAGKISLGKLAFSLVSIGILIAGTQLSVELHNKSESGFTYLRRVNYGLSGSCNVRFSDKPACRTSESPDTVVWGDSFAMQIVEGLKKSKGVDLLQATNSACAPFIGTSAYIPTYKNAGETSRNCIQFNNDVLGYLKKSDSIKKVILAANYAGYTGGTLKMLSQKGDSFVIEPASRRKFTDDFDLILRALMDHHIDVTVVFPPPQINAELLNCMEKKIKGRIFVGDQENCTFSMSQHAKNTKTLNAVLTALQKKYGFKIIYLQDAICSNSICNTIIDGVPIYRDPVHISYAGSEKVFELLGS
ncbi:acyltransferase family protein [uncultured Castellaniella sp.]|uniref:acyltransferase family protein n=1 Tax=uncultured Castellaniella sp. TaxID=647907 RepID=UPI0026354989|nr:acyltransferase family protein [uncultured Castellaniella sp.]